MLDLLVLVTASCSLLVGLGAGYWIGARDERRRSAHQREAGDRYLASLNELVGESDPGRYTIWLGLERKP